MPETSKPSEPSELPIVDQISRLRHRLRELELELELEHGNDEESESVNGLSLSEYKRYGRHMVLNGIGLPGS